MSRFPPKKILVPFDCSKRARLAWEHARLYARRFGSALEAVYVAPFYLGPEVVQLEPMTAGERRRLLDCVARETPGAAAVHVMEGDIVPGILAAARASGADLLVMASAGVRGWKRVARASITESVVRDSPVPVLCVAGRPRPPKSVLAPLALDGACADGLWLAAEAAGAFGAKLEALHVTAARAEEDPKALSLMKERAVSLDAEWREERGRVVPTIVDEARRHGLTVLVEHQPGGFAEGLLGTVTERVLRGCSGSVLAAPYQSA